MQTIGSNPRREEPKGAKPSSQSIESTQSVESLSLLSALSRVRGGTDDDLQSSGFTDSMDSTDSIHSKDPTEMAVR